MEKTERFYHDMLRIRMFEERILQLFSESKVSGTTHTYIGQEATAVALMNNIQEGDTVFSNHRCHGHFLAYGGPMRMLMSEIMAKETGMCKGLGGSQHIHYKNFYSNGIQGGIVPNASGVAWAEKLNQTDHIAAVFIGDGTLGQGGVYETFNLAAIYKIPVLFIIEDNGYAMSTKSSYAVAGSMADRPRAFGIETEEITSNDAEELDLLFARLIDAVRREKAPRCLVIHTYRLAAHSKGDDDRPQEEIAQHKKQDPLTILGQRLDAGLREELREDVLAELTDAEEFAMEQATVAIDLTRKVSYEGDAGEGSILAEKEISGTANVHNALDSMLSASGDVCIIGEDIEDPYGGSFKVTRGLSRKYPGRVLNSPISEASIIGLGVGLALKGKRPIVEMMFGDFISLGFDQILNHAVKYHWMYAGQVDCPLIIRAPMGAGRGYGATHSQSLEKYFVGMPEITVTALSPMVDAEKLYDRILRRVSSPVIVIENKKLYGERLLKCRENRLDEFFVTETDSLFPTIRLSLDEDSAPDAAVVVYGRLVTQAMEVAKRLMLEEEIQLDIIVPTLLAPYPTREIAALTERAPVLGVMEEGNRTMSWGAEVIAQLAEQGRSAKYFRVCAEDLPIPCSVELEKQVMPDGDKLEKTIRSILNV